MRIFEGLDYVHKEGESHAIEVILGVLGEFVEQGKVGSSAFPTRRHGA